MPIISDLDTVEHSTTTYITRIHTRLLLNIWRGAGRDGRTRVEARMPPRAQVPATTHHPVEPHPISTTRPRDKARRARAPERVQRAMRSCESPAGPQLALQPTTAQWEPHDHFTRRLLSSHLEAQKGRADSPGQQRRVSHQMRSRLTPEPPTHPKRRSRVTPLLSDSHAKASA